MSDAPKWTRAERGGGRICEVCKQAIGRRTPAMRRDEETSDFRGDDIVTFRHLHCHQTRALSDKVWMERGGPALTRQRDEAVGLLAEIQWNNREGHQRVIPRCPCCRGIKPGTCDEAELSSLYPDDRVDHAPDCRLAAIRRGEVPHAK